MMQDVLEILRLRDNFLVTSHISPDGDSIGSELALALALQSLGKRVTIINHDPIPGRYTALPGTGMIRVASALDTDYGAAILLECGSRDRPGLAGLDRQFTINIDHHESTSPYGDANWIEPQAAAVGEMIYKLAKALGVSITPEIATNVYVAVLTDTGSFQFSSTTAETFRLAAELADQGIDVASIARAVFYSNPLKKVNMMRLMLNRLQVGESGHLVWVALTQQDMIHHDCVEEDVEGLVNFPLTIVGVDLVVFVRELADGTFRVSFRSKVHPDVSRIAIEFGGGGHRHAAGCRIAGPLPAIQQQLLTAASAHLNGKYQRNDE